MSGGKAATVKNAGKFHRLCIMASFKSDPLPIPVRTPLPSTANGRPDSRQRDRQSGPANQEELPWKAS